MKILQFAIILILAVTPCLSQITTKSLTVDTTLANQYFEKGKTFAGEALFDSSNFYFEKANIIYEQVTTYYSEPAIWNKYVTSLTKLAINFSMTGKYQNSLEYLQKALIIGLEKLGENHITVTNILNELGVVYYYKGEYVTALNFYNKALKKRLELFGPEHPRIADSYNNLAMIFEAKGDFTKSLDYFKKANSIFLNAFGGDHIQVACTYHNIGLMYRKIGDYEQALDYFQKSLAIDIKLSGEENPAVAMTYEKIGTIYGIIGDYEMAFDYFNKSLAIYYKVFGENNSQMATIYNNIGILYQKKGDFDQALEFFKKALVIDHQILGENHPNIAISYGNMGVIYRELGDYDEALEYHNKAMQIHLQSTLENHPFAANTYRNIGLIYNFKGDYDKAIEYYGKALAIQKNLFGEKHPEIADIYQIFGELSLKQLNFKNALLYFQKAIITLNQDFNDTNIYVNPQLRQIRVENQSITTLYLKATALQKYYSAKSLDLKDLKMAYTTYQLTSELIDKVRNIYQAEGSKLLLGEMTSAIFNNAIKVALELYKITRDNNYRERAFLFAEQAKSSVLLSSLQNSRASKFAGIPDSVLDLERQLKINLALYNTQIQKELQKKGNLDSLMLREFQERLFQLNTQYQELIRQLEKDYPKYYDLKYQTQLAKIVQLQQALDQNSILVEYLCGDSTIFIFTITPNDFEVVTVPKDPSFNNSIVTLLRALKKAEISNFIKSAKQVYSCIIKPIEKKLVNKSKLIIIPDDILYRIPFEVLIKTEPETHVDLTKLDYLINKFEILYHYSSTLYLNTLTDTVFWKRKFEAKSFIGFAPVFSEEKQNSFIFSSNIPSLNLARAEADIRTIQVDGKRIQELAYSEKEVSEIIKQYNMKGKTATGYFHTDASEDNFKKQCGKYPLIHISTHGIINEERPQLSSLIFSQPQDSIFIEDGLLYAGETYNLNLQANLVILSSCESGIGKLAKGEGIMALTRGFLYSGASNILVTLWKISDKQTCQLMIDFHKNVLGGKSYSAALRHAKLNMIKNSATAFPKSWGGFVLVGNQEGIGYFF